MKRKARPSTGRKKEPDCSLSREEWDFRAQPEKGDKKRKPDGGKFSFLPDNEVGLCWLYEFARTGPDVEFVLNQRKAAKDPRDFDSLLDHYYRTDPNGKEGFAPVVDWYYFLWPEWPEKPFLKVKERVRKKRYKAMWGQNPDRALRMVPLREIYRYVVDLKAGKKPDLKKLGLWPSDRIEILPDTWVVRKSPRIPVASPREIVALEVDHDLPIKVMKERFGHWLKSRREATEFFTSDTGKGMTKTQRAELCAFGAYRLRESGMTMQAALEHTEKASGKALFSNVTDWSKAKKTALAALDLAN